MSNTSAYVALDHPIIQIHTGADGAWITLRSSKGKSVTFQPRNGCGHQWTEDSICGKALQEWLSDRQDEYENQPLHEPTVRPCDHKTLAEEGTIFCPQCGAFTSEDAKIRWQSSQPMQPKFCGLSAAEVLELKVSAPSQRHTDLITIYSTLLASEYARNGAFSEATASVALSAAKIALRVFSQEIDTHA